jgi:hypothetical protein
VEKGIEPGEAVSTTAEQSLSKIVERRGYWFGAYPLITLRVVSVELNLRYAEFTSPQVLRNVRPG